MELHATYAQLELMLQLVTRTKVARRATLVNRQAKAQEVALRVLRQELQLVALRPAVHKLVRLDTN
jgi:hypothetical protein